MKNLIRSINNNSDGYDEKYMKIKFSLDDNLLSKKILELRNIMIVIRFVFNDGSKCYPQIFLDECFCKLAK